MFHYKNHMTIFITGIILFGLSGCNGNVNKEVNTNAVNKKVENGKKDHKDLTKLKLTYPANWTKRGNENEIFFDDENKKTVGGISLVGYYGDYNSTLPNHSEILNTEDINVSLGKGKLFTLKRSYPAASNNKDTWNEIHAVIPANKNNLAFDIWIKGKKDTLINILRSIQMK